jgi:aminopeptidase N
MKNLYKVVKHFTHIFLLFFCVLLNAQKKQQFTVQDSLRGSITTERIWWDLQHYNLDIEVFPETKFIKGKNTIKYKVLSSHSLMQIDLQAPMKITSATQNSNLLDITRKGNVHYIKLDKSQIIGAIDSICIYFEGNPRTAKNAPWDAGFSWKKDDHGIDFIATSCQGQGASIWWPNKDHMYDEPDLGVTEIFTVPEHLTAVGNGRLIKETHDGINKIRTFIWNVNNPINNYGVNINIGNYTNFTEKFNGENGVLDCSYYVLQQNLKKAKIQFKEAKRTLSAFEHWFGRYPFYQDGYKLVEVPYLGMEHQSSVTYGNGYKNGYRGRDLSQTGWGLKFDFIIVHETGHEWFANNITNKDIADMWIHESFTNYSESLFLDYHFGTKAANEYIIGLRKRIQNDVPIIGQYNVNHEGSGDMYFKGANMLHNIRQIINNDTKWKNILRGLNKEFHHQTVSTAQIENYLIKKSKKHLQPIFNQYLRTIKIPKLEYKLVNNCIEYRWTNCLDNFNMPIKLLSHNSSKWIKPTTKWKKSKLKKGFSEVKIDPNFYIESIRIN